VRWPAVALLEARRDNLRWAPLRRVATGLLPREEFRAVRRAYREECDGRRRSRLLFARSRPLGLPSPS
jgi:hypothetical protein